MRRRPSLSIRLSTALTLLLFTILGTNCSRTDETPDPLFESLHSSHTGIDFQNTLSYTKELNPYTYRNFYNGGGVGIGDFNKDGLQDIFFTGNQVSNRLYLNEGNFKFRDITEKAGLNSKGVWSTGVSVVDINSDGWPDIYISKSGSPEGENRHNELFINNRDTTFTEKSEEYGLNIEGLSTDAVFFDYDRDGDLDMYLLSNSFQPVTDLGPEQGLRSQPDPNGGDRLFRNETINGENNDLRTDQPIFTDVTRDAGIYSSRIGFGLDVMVADMNDDSWPDLYISNDFFERDYLYLNNGDGTFREVLPEIVQSISFSSMGGDIADINHDGYPEIYVTDMLPESWERAKSKTAFDFWEEYIMRVQNGYFHQFVRNTLQLNTGPLQLRSDSVGPGNADFRFREIGRLTGTEATDWSWTALFADLDLNGTNDIYVTNGIYKDLTDQDYVSDSNSLRKFRSVIEDDQPVGILFDDIPSTPVKNYAFSKVDSLNYENLAEEWGLAGPGFSNGAAYADLDNDGDLDLVVNNVNSEAAVYRNRSETLEPEFQGLMLYLQGKSPNTFAVGAKAKAWVDGTLYYREQQPMRGFQSSVDPRLHFGFGLSNRIDSLIIEWPSGAKTVKRNIQIDSSLTVREPAAIDLADEAESPTNFEARPIPKSLFQNVSKSVILDYRHSENEFVDFNRERLLYEMHSTEGPASCIADVNNDGLDDLYLGGAKGQAGGLYLQQVGFNFRESEQGAFIRDKESEDTDCTWFDADGDGYPDLYVSSGGSEFPSSSSSLADRLYINRQGVLTRNSTLLPQSQYEIASVAIAGDFDKDGDQDLFTGSRMQPFAYGVPANGNILVNDGEGKFSNMNQEKAPFLEDIGLITDAQWFDYDNDGDDDLIITGEWMPLTILRNMLTETGEAAFQNVTEELELGKTNGLWKSVTTADVNGDGFKDIIAGNIGLNSRLTASPDAPLKLWINDFDRNGSIEQILTMSDKGRDIPLVLRQDFMEQMPRIDQRISDYKSYSQKEIQGLFSEDELEGTRVSEIYELRSMILFNQAGRSFKKKVLPEDAQITPLYASLAVEDGLSKSADILTAGNLSAVKPLFGAYQSGFGTVLSIDSNRNINIIDYAGSGFFVEGEVRAIHKVKSSENILFLVIRNNNSPVWFKKTSDL